MILAWFNTGLEALSITIGMSACCYAGWSAAVLRKSGRLLGGRVADNLLGECLMCLVITLFAAAQMAGALRDMPDTVTSAVRILTLTVALITTRRMAKTIRGIESGECD